SSISTFATHSRRSARWSMGLEPASRETSFGTEIEAALGGGEEQGRPRGGWILGSTQLAVSRTAVGARTRGGAGRRPGRSRASGPAGGGFRARLWRSLAVIGLLMAHYALAARSLLEENPTVDEVVHLPAGVTYWQKGTFRLYHHNPPLFKLWAALPVVLAGP